MAEDIISRRAAIETLSELGHFESVNYLREKIKNTSISLLNDVPSIDPVHAAGGCYCHECEHYDNEHPVMLPRMSIPGCACAYWSLEDAPVVYTKPDDFCSYGERRE